MTIFGAPAIVLLVICTSFSSVSSFSPSVNILKQQQQHNGSFNTNKIIKWDSIGRTLYSTGSTSGEPPIDETDKGVLIGLLNGFFKRERKQSQQQGSSVNAKDIVVQLVRNRNCYATVKGAKEFAETCADNIVYEDCYLSDPVFGKKVGTDSVLSFLDSTINHIMRENSASFCISSYNFALRLSLGS
jgi:hypothetical protein